MPDTATTTLKRTLDVSTVAFGLGALALLLFELGFPLTIEERQNIIGTVRVVLWAVLALQTIRAFVAADWRRAAWQSAVPIASNGVLILLLAFEQAFVRRLHAGWPDITAVRWEVLYLTTIHVLVLALLGKRLLHFNQLLAFARVSPRTLLISSYLGVIASGTILLKLPNATTASISWVDALFTSTSAVCVTGLIVVDTATAFTPTGHTIVLGLFQLGGLGLMTFTYFFVSVFGSGITIKDRALLLEFLNEEYVGRVTGSLIAIVLMTLTLEAAGAVLLHAFTPDVPGKTWFASVFHAVSGFCNAGFSVYTEGLYDPIARANVPYQAVIMALVVISGLGFPVLKNLWDNWTARAIHPQRRPPRLTTHTKIVLVTSVALLVLGTVLFYVFELGSPERPGEAPRWASALFLSVTTRSSGFNTTPTDALLAPTAILAIALMFIGGAPAGTAGGIKTTTFAIALLNTFRILKDVSGDLIAFRRQIPGNVANRAFAVALLAVTWVICSTIALTALMPGHDALDVLFEVVSAFATVGLSRGITPELPTAGKIIITVSMLVGRIGILYVALGVLRKDRPGRIAYPEANVIIS
jgi:trk system potassium uptake protein